MKYTSILFLLLTITFFTCKNKNATEAPKTKFVDLDVQQFDKMRINKDVVVLDVRTPAEVAQGIIDNAIVIDINGSDFDTKIQTLDKNKTYLVYCKVGGRSAKACRKMSDKGFSELYNLNGGYTAWSKTNQ